MIITKRNTIILLFFISISQQGFTQINSSIDTTKYYHLILIDKSNFNCKIIYENKDSIAIKAKSIGIVYIQKSKIKKLNLINGEIKDGVFVRDINIKNQYSYIPTAYPLKKNTAIYTNSLLAFNRFNFGLTNKTILDINVMPGNGLISWLGIRTTILNQKEKIKVGVGLTGIANINSRVSRCSGSSYSILTIGNSKNNFTIGGGIQFPNTLNSMNYFYVLGAVFKIENNLYILFDNMIFHQSKAISTHFEQEIISQKIDYNVLTGFNFIGLRIDKPRMTFDIGVGLYGKDSDFLPTVNFHLPLLSNK